MIGKQEMGQAFIDCQLCDNDTMTFTFKLRSQESEAISIGFGWLDFWMRGSIKMYEMTERVWEWELKSGAVGTPSGSRMYTYDEPKPGDVIVMEVGCDGTVSFWLNDKELGEAWRDKAITSAPVSYTHLTLPTTPYV